MTDAERIEEQVWTAVFLVVKRRQVAERRRVFKDHATELRDLAERGLNPADMADRIDPRPTFDADGHLRARTA